VSKQKKGKKPQKVSRPLTARKAILKGNEDLLSKIKTALSEQEGRVQETSKQLYSNQMQLHKGQEAAEEHLLLLRRVINDMLAGTVHTVDLEREIFGSEEKTTVKVVNWGWYTAQMDFADTRESFMNGVVLPDAEIETRILKKKKLEQYKILDQTIGNMVAQDADKMRKLLDDQEELKKFFIEYLAKIIEAKEDDIDWSDQMTDAASSMIKNRLSVMDRLKDLKDLPPEEQQKAMHKAKAELLEESKEFAKVAGKAVAAIKSGNKEAAAEAFDEMERRVEAKEREADGLPPKDDGIPDGAAVFGGDQ
jgi:hypothetical protein